MKTTSVAVMLMFGATGFAQRPAKTPTVEIPAERLDIPLGEPLSVRALVTKPLPITAVMSWTLESRRHRGAIWCHALSRDGKILATGGLDGTIRLWDVETGNLVRALVGHNSYVSGLDFSPDGNTLASAGTYDITVRLWDTRTGRPLRILRGHPAEVTHVKWAPDGKSILASGGQSGTLSAWNAITGVKNESLKLGESILGMSWHPDGKSAALVGHGLALRIWDANKNAITRVLGNAKDQLGCVAWDPDGKTIAVGTPKETQLIDAASGKVTQTLPHAAFIVTWLQGGKQLAATQSNGTQIFDVASPKVESGVATNDARGVYFAASEVVVASWGSFSIHDRGTGKVSRTFDNLSGTEPPLWWAGKTLVTGVGATKLSQWDADTGKRIRLLEGHTTPITAVTVAPGGKLLGTASYDKTVRIWETPTGKPVHTFSDHAAAVLAVAFAPDGKTVASSGADKKVLIWDASSGKLLHTLTGSETDVTALAWRPAASTPTLLTNGKGVWAQLWNVRAAKVETVFKGTVDMVSLGWSPDGSKASAGQSDGDLVIWQAATGKVLHTLKEPGSPPQVASLAWSPKGQAIASGRGNHTMQLWDPKTGNKFVSIPTMAPVVRVSWTPSGATVGVSSQDRTIRFFDAGTGKLRSLLLAEEEQLVAVGFDGHFRAPAAETELVYVVQTKSGQDTYTPTQFAAKFKLKNAPAKVNLFGN